MNICVFTHTYPRYSGDPVAPFMKDFSLGLSHNNSVVVLTPFDTHFLSYISSNNLRVELYKYIIPNNLHRLGYSRTLVGDQKLKLYVYFLSPFMFIFSLIALLKVIRKYNIEVISAHWIVPNGFIAAIASKITGVPLIVTVPGSDAYLARKNVIFNSMAKLAGKRATYIVSNSMRYLDELADTGVDKRKFREIPYGVDISRYEYPQKGKLSLRKKLGIMEDEKVILSVGRLVEKKGFEYLIKAMPSILESLHDAKLIIVGDGYEKNKLQELTQRFHVENRVSFAGKVNHSDLPSFYGVADVYVAPSVKDSHGNLESHIVALFEAIAAGLPIVTTKLGASKKYVNGKNGHRVNEKDEVSIAKSIINILSSPNIDSMGKESRRIAEKYLSYEECANQYSQLFKSLKK